MLSLPELKQKAAAEADPQPGSGPKVIGYRRVWNGGCDHCQLASERLYFVGELAPIHDGCQCGVVPVFEGEDHGLFTTRKGQSPLPAKMVVEDSRLGNRLDQSVDPGAPYVDTAWMDKESARWLESLDENVHGSFDQYGQNDAFTLNAALRQKDEKLKDWQWLADILNKNMWPVPQDIRTYRGFGGTFEEVFGAPPKVGGVIHDDGFLSTTLKKSVADEFAESHGLVKDGKGLGSIVEIITPKGTPVAWMENITVTGEAEVLLPSGLDLEIVKVVSPTHIVVKVISRG